MRPIVLPLVERLGRFALNRSGTRSVWVDTPAGKLHAYDARGRGAGPTIVLLHGIGASATPFGPMIARLRRTARRVVAVELPGHGFSELHGDALTGEGLFNAVAAGLQKLVPEPMVLMGNSLGGAVSLHYAASFPERVLGLVLVSPAGAHATDAEWEALKSRFAVDSRASAREFLGLLYHRTPWFIPLLAHELPASFARRAVRELLDSASNDHLPPPDSVMSLSMPVLFLWGKSERLLPPSHFAWFRKHLPPGAVVEEPEGFGHCPHLDSPGRLARRIASFAASLPPRSGDGNVAA